MRKKLHWGHIPQPVVLTVKNCYCIVILIEEEVIITITETCQVLQGYEKIVDMGGFITYQIISLFGTLETFLCIV